MSSIQPPKLSMTPACLPPDTLPPPPPSLYLTRGIPIRDGKQIKLKLVSDIQFRFSPSILFCSEII